MRNFPVLLFIALFSLKPYTKMLAQCGISATITTTESRCINNGTITIQVNAGTGPFLYQLYVGSTLYDSSITNTFIDLYPNTYTVKVIGVTDTCNFTAIVQGNYIAPGNSDYTTTLNHVTACYNGNNGLANSIATNGRLPYLYNILGGPTNINITNAIGNFSGLSAGIYTLKATDSCGSHQSRIVTINNFNWQINSHAVQKIGCSMYKLDTVMLSKVVPNVKYLVKRGTDTLGFGSSPKITFTNPDSNINSLLICAIDSCGYQHCVPINAFMGWGISAVVANLITCDSVSISSYIITGTPATNFQFGYITNTNDTIPLSSSAAAIYFSNILLFYAKDSCGIMKTAPLSFLQRKLTLSAEYINCDSSSLSATISGNFLAPFSYSINGTTVLTGSSNSTYTFNNLVDSTYYIVVTDACGNTASTTTTVSHDWYSGGHWEWYCIKKFKHFVYMVNRMKRPVKIVRYNASFITAIDSAVYNGPDSLFNGAIKPIQILDHVTFYDTVSYANYKYIVTDACGRKDTVSIMNDAYPTPDSLLSTVSSNCPPDTIKGKIKANYFHHKNILNPAQLSCTNLLTPSINISPNLCHTNITSNADTCYWNNMDTGIYIVKMSTLNCPDQMFDTVTISAYRQPKIDTAYLYFTGPNTTCHINVLRGVPPYNYKVKSTVPIGGDTNTIHTVTPFTIANQYNQLHLVVSDACGNGPHVFANKIPQIPLPLNGITASGNLNLLVANIYWTSNEEKNVDYFEIQRSVDAQNFRTITTKQAVGNTNGHSIYKIQDDVKAYEHFKAIYYRVIAKDIDGVTEAISNIVSIILNQKSDNVIAYPSPFNTNFNIMYSSFRKAKIKIGIYDITGKIVYEQSNVVQPGIHNFEIWDLASLTAGLYFIHVYNETLNQKFVRKISKQ